MIPEIEVTCRGERLFINSVTVEQYKKYISLMEKNDTEKFSGVMFFNKKIMQEMFGNELSLAAVGEIDAVEFLTAIKTVHVFVKMPSDKQLNKVREWLLYAVTKAEKELGGGTGQIKLRYVYDMFVARFTWLARVISFEAFSMMVDEALERMKKMLESNKAMQTLVSGEAGETVEKDM